MKLFFFFVIFGFSLYSWCDPITDSLVQVSSEFYNITEGKATLPVRLHGAGLLFKLVDSNRQFVLTASHLSNGSKSNSLEIKTADGQLLKVIARSSDNLRDLEVIEVEPNTKNQPSFSYKIIETIGMLDKFCTKILPWDDSSRIVYSKTDKTRIFLPFPKWVPKPTQKINSLDFYDRFALASPRITYDGLYTKEFLSESRFNSVFRLDEPIFDNPVRAGMSGLPIMAEVSDQWDDTSPRTEICMISLVQAYHRILPRSFGASINHIQEVVRRAIHRESFNDTIQWSMESGLTYRHDATNQFRETIFVATTPKTKASVAAAPAGASLLLDGGSGASVDGGSGASVDGGSGASVDGGNYGTQTLSANLLPGLYDNGAILAYQFEDQTIYADFSSYRFSRENFAKKHFTTIPYPPSAKALTSLFASRLEASNEGIRSQLFRSQQLIKWSIQDIEARSFFEGKLEHIEGNMTQWTLKPDGPQFLRLLKEYMQSPWYDACVVNNDDLEKPIVTIRLINNSSQKGATDFIYFRVNLKGQLDSYYDTASQKWQSVDDNQPEYLPFYLPSTKPEDSIYVDTKGLLFMDLHDAFKHLIRNPEQSLRRLDRMMKQISQFSSLISNYHQALTYLGSYEDAFDFFLLDRNIKFLTAFVEHISPPTKIFIEPRPGGSAELSPTGDLLSRMAHIVVTPTRTGMSWPILCTSQDLEIP